MIKQSCENPSIKYVCVFGFRFIFRDGKYMGWYDPELGHVV